MMPDVQIIAFTVPWPANYGGVIDIYYRLEAFHRAGIKVELHCFQYDRNQAPELENICSNVYYYPRKAYIASALSDEPYITASRTDKLLRQRINAMSCPVLMEGIHSTHLLFKDEVDASRAFIRIHNIEHHYYRLLAEAENNFLKRIYFAAAAKKLKKFEDVYGKAAGMGCISESETTYYQNKFGPLAFHLPAFHPYQEVIIPGGSGDYVLYHGNLAIAENHKAAMFLLQKVATHSDFPFIFAGKSPQRALLAAAARLSNVKIIADPSQAEMEQLIRDAHVHALPTFQETGVKLKLLAALYRGRFVVTNPSMTQGTGLGSLCTHAADAYEFREAIKVLMSASMTEEITSERKRILESLYNNDVNVQILRRKMKI